MLTLSTKWTDAKRIDHPHYGCLVSLASSQNNFGNSLTVPWNNTAYDNSPGANWHDDVTNNTRLTVPTGITRVRLLGSFVFNQAVAMIYVRIFRGGLNATGSANSSDGGEQLATSSRQSLTSPTLEVSAGDFFEIDIQSEVTDRDLLADSGTWFAIEGW